MAVWRTYFQNGFLSSIYPHLFKACFRMKHSAWFEQMLCAGMLLITGAIPDPEERGWMGGLCQHAHDRSGNRWYRIAHVATFRSSFCALLLQLVSQQFA